MNNAVELYRNAADILLQHGYMSGRLYTFCYSQRLNDVMEQIDLAGWSTDQKETMFLSYNEETDFPMLLLFIACALETGD